MQMGYQGKYINILVEDLNLNKELPHLKERLGHRVSEVLVGGIYGAALTLLLIKILS
jgi:acid phosphatase family membrane protein YuiD